MLSGHKHVPYAWRLEDLFVVNAGNCLDHAPARQDQALLQPDRGSPERVTVYRKYPFHEQDAILTFDPRTYDHEKSPSLLGETATG